MNTKNQTIMVIDYGMGNIGSVINMLRHVGAKAEVATHPEQLDSAAGIILPGVGHFDRAMWNLWQSGMADALTQVVKRASVPVLGICLGMQLMCNSSEEGSKPGLGFIDASVRRFNFEANLGLKVPHMGWNEVVVQRERTLLGGTNDPLSRYYFVHSYYVSCANRQDIIGTTQFGIEFVSAFQRGTLVGVQFHPEKSAAAGLQLLANFVRWQPGGGPPAAGA